MTANKSIFLMLVFQLVQIMTSYGMESAPKRRKIDKPDLGQLLKKAFETERLDDLENVIREAQYDCDVLITLEEQAGIPVSYTMLGHAAQRKHLVFVDYLIKQGACVDKPGYCQRTPLLALVTSRWDSSRSLAIMERLLDAGASVNVSDRSGNTALHFLASRKSEVRAIKLLVNHGASTDQKATSTGSTPLHSAVMNDNQDAFHALVQASASLFIKNNWHESPIELAKRSNGQGFFRDYASIVDWILPPE